MSTIQTNSITDAAGTGAPDFPNGIEVATGQNIVIGTDSGDPFNANSRIRIQGAGDEWIQIKSDGTGAVGLLFGDTTDDFTAGIQSDQTDSASMLFFANNAQRMKIDFSGNVLVGKTASDVATVGAEIRANGVITGTVNGGAAAFFNRTTSDGPLVSFRKDNTTLGSIEAFNGAFCIAGITATGPQVKIMNNTTSVLTLGAYASASQYGYIGDESGGAVGVAFVNVGLLPVTANDGALADNTFDIGGATGRWDDIYATNNVIQTSDRNEKQDIEELNDAERRVAVACKGLLRKYRWISSVAEKGDEARIHFGIIAQDLQAAFAAEGLDAGRYAMFISSTWWEHDGKIYDTAEEAPEGATERTRLGVRYPELLAFIIAAI